LRRLVAFQGPPRSLLSFHTGGRKQTSMTQMNSSGWGTWSVLAQTGSPAPASPSAGAAPAPAAPQSNAAAPASGTTTTPGGATGTGQQQSPFGGTFMILMLVMVGVMLLTSIMAGKKDKKKRAELMSNLKKQDKVQMLGGIIGTVVEIGDDDTLVLKVEEGRIRFHKSSVQGIISSRGKGDASITEVKGEAKAATV